MKILKPLRILAVVTLAIILSSCRGEPFKKPPIHPNMNMDQQNRKEAQEVNTFFKDNRSMRQPVEGTIARGHLKLNSEYYRGVDADGNYVPHNPINVTKSFLYHGQDRFDIYCTPCHGGLGDGKGIVMVGQYGYVPAPSYHTDRIRNMPDGEIFSAITNGVRTMPSYASQIPVRDRWAIVAYIRALQESQHATKQQVQDMGGDLAKITQDYKQQQEAQAKRDAAKKAAQGKQEVSADRGKQLFAQNGCQSCHSIDGSKGVGPTLQGLFGHKVELQSGETITADEDYISESIHSPHTKIVKGYQPVMPQFGSMLSDADIQSLVEYIKTLK